MRLTLSILRCPPSVPPEMRAFDGGEISIGRGPGNDWVLPDPDRHLSKRHCALAFHGGDWQLADLSSNGTFVNGEVEPLGAGLPRRLRSGDRIRFGAYEIEVVIGPAPLGPDPAWSNPFGTDPYAAARPFAEEGDPLPPVRGITLPADFDPLAEDGGDPAWHSPQREEWRQPTQSDHSPATSDVFRPPAPGSILPDDWAAEWADDPLPQAPPPSRPPPENPPARRRSAPPRFAEPPAEMARPAPAPPPAAPPPAPDALLAAFLRGAGLPPTVIDDPEALMQQLGEVVRALVTGLRQSLIARSAIKSEFRIERTLIAARGNNPLKFAADDDDALAALVGNRRRSDMPPDQAVAEALRDMRLHELATMAAMQAAVRALVARLDPAPLFDRAGGALPVSRKARAWEAFEDLHATISQALADDFDGVFGKSFARAYEQAQSEIGREATGKEPRTR